MRMTEAQANAVFDVLVAQTRVSDTWRDQFVRAHTLEGCREFRLLGGRLKLGGKFRSETWRVDCYAEDRTPERDLLIEDTNGRLAKLRAELGIALEPRYEHPRWWWNQPGAEQCADRTGGGRYRCEKARGHPPGRDLDPEEHECCHPFLSWPVDPEE